VLALLNFIYIVNISKLAMPNQILFIFYTIVPNNVGFNMKRKLKIKKIN
jgi:hypothetical protein